MTVLTPPPDPADVLFEQLEFLLLHRATCKIPVCPVCVRFAKAQNALMAPFWGAR